MPTRYAKIWWTCNGHFITYQVTIKEVPLRNNSSIYKLLYYVLLQKKKKRHAKTKRNKSKNNKKFRWKETVNNICFFCNLCWKKEMEIHITRKSSYNRALKLTPAKILFHAGEQKRIYNFKDTLTADINFFSFWLQFTK